MLRRSLFVSALMLAGVVGFASSAKAENATLTMSGTVGTACTLTNPTPGTLVPNTGNTVLKSDNTVGTSATINISCSGGNLSIAAPTRVGSVPAATFDSLKATITTADGTMVESPGGTTTTTAAMTATDNGIAEVDMTATSATALEAGTYNFTVVVTAGAID